MNQNPTAFLSLVDHPKSPLSYCRPFFISRYNNRQNTLKKKKKKKKKKTKDPQKPSTRPSSPPLCFSSSISLLPSFMIYKAILCLKNSAVFCFVFS